MKCPHCGGSVIEDPGCFPHGPERKCMSCGRYVMDTEKKTCIKCGKESPKTEEYFRKNSFTKDGFEGQCKKCRKKYFEDYRAGIRARSKSSKPAPDPRSKRKYVRQVKSVAAGPLTSATPAEILIALRKGMAAEIVAMINEKYDL